MSSCGGTVISIHIHTYINIVAVCMKWLLAYHLLLPYYRVRVLFVFVGDEAF